MPDFDKFWDDNKPVEAPKAQPSGHYTATVTGVKFDQTKKDPPRPMARVTFKLESPEDDAIENGADAKSAKGVLVDQPFFPDTPKGLYEIEQFASATCGIDTTGLSTKEKLEQCKGSPVRVFLKSPREYNGRFSEDVGRVLPAEG